MPCDYISDTNNFFRKYRRALILAVLAVSTFYPRLVLLGGFPAMDEGYYGWQAKEFYEYLTAGRPLPDGMLNLYPLLLCWLCALPGKTILWLRMADFIVALVSGWLFCEFILRKTGKTAVGLLISFVFLCALNMESVINSGFKNSITAAWIPVFCALLLYHKNLPARSIRWFFMGCLAALATLLREPFGIFAILGLFPVAHLGGFYGLFLYISGGLCSAIPVLLTVCMLHEHFLSVFAAYLQSVDVYSTQADQVWHNFISNGWKALRLFIFPILLTLTGLLLHRQSDTSDKALKITARLSVTGKGKRHNLLYEKIFWLAAFLLPVSEPFFKIGFLYHFAVALPGLAALCAFYWSLVPEAFLKYHTKSVLSALTAMAVGSLFVLPSPTRLPGNMENFITVFEQEWPDTQSHNSNTLLTAKIIQKNLKPGATLASSGFTYFLYGASGFYPPFTGQFAQGDRYRLSDLARSFRVLGYDPVKLAKAITLNPPDMIVLSRAVEEHEQDWHSQLLEAVNMSKLYKPLDSIRPDPAKNYGWLDFQLFKRNDL